MFGSPFFEKEQIKLSTDSVVVFVADMFVDQYLGGAELTSQALIDSCPFPVDCIQSKDVTVDLLSSGVDKFWIFGNFANLDFNLIPSIVANLNYSILEYDYKFCRHRSPEKHAFAEKEDCNCHIEPHGQLISTFFHGAQSLWFMSEKQLDRYYSRFETLREINCTVLSSVFDDDFFVKIKQLREESADKDRKGWIVLGSGSWIKGSSQAEEWCVSNNLEYEKIWGLSYLETLEKLSTAEGFVYLPMGGDTCPRMVIEAKLLGCKLHLNDFVEHSNELWFNTEDSFDTEAYLYAARERFWSSISASINYNPTISGYTTTKNCIDQGYPWKQCIGSMLGFADEVVVVDGGSTDGTWETLQQWAETEEKLKVFSVKKDWDHKRFAVFDGMQKAEARSRCTSEFLWQQDADEVVHEKDYEKIKNLCKNFPRATALLSLPVVEFWGSSEKVRCDINPWKWRLSVNHPNITHGIPAELRRFDSEGHLFAAPGTDGCDIIFSDSFERVPHANFYSEEVNNVRVSALSGNVEAKGVYQKWFQNAIDMLPSIYHYSWIDIERKMYTYKNYWQKHWESLFDIKQEDTADHNMFFNKPWSEVSDEEIKSMASKLGDELGGWIFHRKVDFNSPTPHISINTTQPKSMLNTDAE